ncbi:MAG: CopD family protein [Chloroflexi bacterium]|nr:CopD family protein [Chloroflexota bacterium]
MDMALLVAARWLHLLAATTWVGGLIFMNLVLTPAVSARGIPPAPVRMMGIARFRPFAWGSIGVILVTGLVNLFRGAPSLDFLFATAWGNVILVKIFLFAAMVVVTGVNSWFVFPHLRQQAAAPRRPGSAVPGEKALVLLSRTNLALGVAALLAVAVLRQV